MAETERREPLDLEPIRQRLDRFRRYEEAAGSELAAGEHAAAIAAAWDVEPLLVEVERMRAAVNRVRALADGMAAESPKPGVGGFIAEGIYDALAGNRAAAGAGVGSPAVEGQPPPTPDQTEEVDRA